MTRRVLTAAAICTIAASAFAGGTWDSSGTGTGQALTEAFEVSGDHMVMDARIDFSDHKMADPDSPLAGLTGPCFGSMESVAGTLSGGGKCVLTDGDGDVLVLDWTAERWAEGGSFVTGWQVASGTGKWDGASGSGESQHTIDPDTGAAMSQVAGEVTLR